MCETKDIYKITNKINGKIYIGQSNNCLKRFQQHKNTKYQYTSLISRAIKKYGVENFTFEIIEHDVTNYNEREMYWIQYFNSLKPNGYNILPGGNVPPVHKGVLSHKTTHSINQVEMVKYLLKSTELSPSEIGEITGYDKSAVERINAGKIWNDPEQIYPIRHLKRSQTTNKERWERIVDLLMNTDLTHREISEICNVAKSTVTMINIGKNGRQYNIQNYPYPIRQK